LSFNLWLMAMQIVLGIAYVLCGWRMATAAISNSATWIGLLFWFLAMLSFCAGAKNLVVYAIDYAIKQLNITIEEALVQGVLIERPQIPEEPDQHSN